MNSRTSTDTSNSAWPLQDREAAVAATDVLDSIVTKLLRLQDFARIALRDELDGGQSQAEATDVMDAISNAIGAARTAESKTL
jgi:hypothetical protein